MVDIVKQMDRLAKNLERTWTKTIKDVEKKEEYNRSAVVRFARIEMERLIKRALNMSPEELRESFEPGSPSPETFFDLGAEHFKSQLSKALTEEGRLLEADKLQRTFQENREEDLKNAEDTVRPMGKDELEPLNKYMYFSFGLRSILDICPEQIQEIPSIDFREKADKAVQNLKEFESDLEKMDEDLHSDEGLLHKCDSEIKDLQGKISKIREDGKQLAAEIKGDVDKKMLPELGNLEGLIRDTKSRMRKLREDNDTINVQIERIENARDATKDSIRKLEVKIKEDLQQLYDIAEDFLGSDETFLVIRKEIFANLGENEEALLNGLEFGLKKYKIENANVSKRTDATMADIEHKIESMPQYNTAIPRFWVQVLKHVYEMSHEVAKEHGEFKSSVDIEWQKGIAEVLNSLNKVFEDKDALTAMKIAGDYNVPLFQDGAEIWNRYQKTDQEIRKRLYEKMRSYSTNPTYLKVAIPAILSKAIMRVAIDHRDLAEFIWFCSVAYDEMWVRYKDLINEMLIRIQG